jgi:hypothetical protein
LNSQYLLIKKSYKAIALFPKMRVLLLFTIIALGGLSGAIGDLSGVTGDHYVFTNGVCMYDGTLPDNWVIPEFPECQKYQGLVQQRDPYPVTSFNAVSLEVQDSGDYGYINYYGDDQCQWLKYDDGLCRNCRGNANVTLFYNSTQISYKYQCYCSGKKYGPCQ